VLVNSDLEENKDCFFNNTKLEASADVIYNYQYYDIIGIINIMWHYCIEQCDIYTEKNKKKIL